MPQFLCSVGFGATEREQHQLWLWERFFFLGFYFEQSVPWFHFFVKDSVYSVLQHLLLLSA